MHRIPITRVLEDGTITDGTAAVEDLPDGRRVSDFRDLDGAPLSLPVGARFDLVVDVGQGDGFWMAGGYTADGEPAVADGEPAVVDVEVDGERIITRNGPLARTIRRRVWGAAGLLIAAVTICAAMGTWAAVNDWWIPAVPWFAGAVFLIVAGGWHWMRVYFAMQDFLNKDGGDG